jgi:hypothetical protein
MINYIWNKIKNIFKPKRQEEPVVLQRNKTRTEHCTKHNRFRKNCLSCREAIA